MPEEEGEGPKEKGKVDKDVGEPVVAAKLCCVAWGEVEDEKVERGQLPVSEVEIKRKELGEGEICKVERVDEDNGKAGEGGGKAERKEAVCDGGSEILQT